MLQSNPELAGAMSRKIAEIKLRNEAFLADMDKSAGISTAHELANGILDKIKRFFSLG